MQFEWDENKNQANIAKHGIDFEQTKAVFNDPFLLVFFDERQEYNELREMAIGKIPLVTQDKLIIVVVVYTERNGNTRIISARKANKPERRREHPIFAILLSRGAETLVCPNFGLCAYKNGMLPRRRYEQGKIYP